MWIVFFGCLLIALFVVNPDDAPLFTTWQFRLGYILSYLIFMVFLRLTIMRLKRIDADAEYIYVSNYFKTYRYRFEDIQSISETNYYLFKVMHFKLKAKGSFGNNILILADDFRIGQYNKAFPDNLKELL
jgi:hypothetical protein